ncbi:hypothetical protein RDI58_003875 [Solanum bulbocastanum]|uniref:Endonuclease/exonuclease/phosphatase domain-containing protein n=1 Tax=Solanum bulbocastanum TaxID=147425 RepID=A0AAN8U0H2_SOLBU
MDSHLKLVQRYDSSLHSRLSVTCESTRLPSTIKSMEPINPVLDISQEVIGHTEEEDVEDNKEIFNDNISTEEQDQENFVQQYLKETCDENGVSSIRKGRSRQKRGQEGKNYRKTTSPSCKGKEKNATISSSFLKSSAIIWNIRDVRSRKAIHKLKRLTNKYKVDMVAISEPMVNGNKVEGYKRFLGFDHRTSGCNGQLWCFWRNSCIGSIIQDHEQHISLKIKKNQGCENLLNVPMLKDRISGAAWIF